MVMSKVIKVQASFYVNVSDKLGASLSSGASDRDRFVSANCFRNNTRRLIDSSIEHLLDTSNKNTHKDFFNICDSLEELKEIGINFKGVKNE